MRRVRVLVLLAAAATAASLTPAAAAATRGPELTETARLADRRAVVVGERAWVMGAADGRYPATGWHVTGEMGGFWAPPVKLLDGLWVGVNGRWTGPATSFTSGHGYTRTTLPTGVPGLKLERTDVVPDTARGTLVGLTFTAAARQRVELQVDARSELMSAYPWGATAPDAGQFNLRDEARFDGTSLVFTERGTPAVPNAAPHDYAALVASTLRPAAGTTGRGFRGPQEPPVVCPRQAPLPVRCDDSAFGNGAGGRLTYAVDVPRGRATTVWLAVAGSDRGVADARAQLGTLLDRPDRHLRAKQRARADVARRSTVDLPGDRLLQRSVEWSKQNLADSVQTARGLQLRAVEEGTAYPPAQGELRHARWLAAGFPDYPWVFGTDGEYTAFAAVAAGQYGPIQDHLRTLRDASDVVNDRSGKVLHEMTPDGAVYFGTLDSAGNTDETAKFPSAVALIWRWTGDRRWLAEMYDFTRRNMRWVVAQDADGDGWPEGLGNVEREGMGAEKLDNAVYTIRGLRDLADLAAATGDTATAQWAAGRASRLQQRFESTWWHEQAGQYADSLDEDGRVFQRHWIGVTPMEALVAGRPLASRAHGAAALVQRERDCYTGDFGLFHTGSGPTSAEGGNRGPSCDDEVSAVQSERSVYSLNTAIMAVGEGNFGRLGAAQQQRYTTANARIQLDPGVWEQPGAMPEVAPSPDFEANVDRPFTDRSMVLQAWGTYGTLWPVVAQQLGVRPDLGRGRLAVVPQIPEAQHRISGRDVELGSRSVDVSATRDGRRLTTTVTLRGRADLTIGHVLPAGARVAAVTLDGRRVPHTTSDTTRGRELLVRAGDAPGRHTLRVTLAR